MRVDGELFLKSRTQERERQRQKDREGEKLETTGYETWVQ